ncbi:DNA-binding CsgD family transcriptional regulator [Pseudomonas moraviensis]
MSTRNCQGAGGFRELDVGRLMLSGCSSKEIARKLEIFVETVKVHKKHMYSKPGINSRSELFSIFAGAERLKMCD